MAMKQKITVMRTQYFDSTDNMNKYTADMIKEGFQPYGRPTPIMVWTQVQRTQEEIATNAKVPQMEVLMYLQSYAKHDDVYDKEHVTNLENTIGQLRAVNKEQTKKLLRRESNDLRIGFMDAIRITETRMNEMKAQLEEVDTEEPEYLKRINEAWDKQPSIVDHLREQYELYQVYETKGM